MKDQVHFVVTSITKRLAAQLQLINILSYFFLFGCGIPIGVILSTCLNKSSVNLNFTQLSVSNPDYSTHALPNITQLSHCNTTTSNHVYVTKLSISNRTSSMSFPPPAPLNTSITLPRIGLKEFLRVPEIKHDMEDEELLWRASLSPLISGYPFNVVPKVAFLFLTKGPVTMAPLWEKFFKGHNGLYSIYIHSSPSYNETQPESPVFHGRRIPSKVVQWGKVNMIEAERRLLANALLDFSNQRFVLLSESCIPLFNFSTVYSYLMNSTHNFVESYDLEGPVGRGRYNPKMAPEVTIHHWRKGSQWFGIDRELALQVVSDQKYFPMFQKYCKGNCYADEHYLPTFVSKNFGKKNSNRTLTWVDWSKGGPHPTRFVRTEVHPEFLERLRSGRNCLYNGKKTTICYLFARKFLPTTLDRLLRFAPKVMHFNK